MRVWVSSTILWAISQTRCGVWETHRPIARGISARGSATGGSRWAPGGKTCPVSLATRTRTAGPTKTKGATRNSIRGRTRTRRRIRISTPLITLIKGGTNNPRDLIISSRMTIGTLILVSSRRARPIMALITSPRKTTTDSLSASSNRTTNNGTAIEITKTIGTIRGTQMMSP